MHFHSLSGFSRQSPSIGAYELVAKGSDRCVIFTYQIEVQYVCMCEYMHVHVGYSVSGHVCLSFHPTQPGSSMYSECMDMHNKLHVSTR